MSIGLVKAPRWVDGLPYCSEESCPSYDGKRCRILGAQPQGLCEPEVRFAFTRLRRLQSKGPLHTYGSCTAQHGVKIEVREAVRGRDLVRLDLDYTAEAGENEGSIVEELELDPSQAEALIALLRAFIDGGVT